MNKAKIFEILMFLMMALADDKIDAKEAEGLLMLLLKMAGIPEWQSKRYRFFLEPDGDLHIILNVDLLKNLKIAL